MRNKQSNVLSEQEAFDKQILESNHYEAKDLQKQIKDKDKMMHLTLCS